MDSRYEGFARAYAAMTPERREAERLRLFQEVAAFSPTPIAERELFRTGQWLQDRGRNLVGHFEGYTEQSVAVQLSRGLGSMIVGLAGSPLGAAGRLALFGAMGIGEASERAVQFDRAERAAGRPGITHEQIVLAGLMGVGPGATDILPVENLLLSLRAPGMTPAVARGLARVIGRVGGRAFLQAAVEGGQEGLQQFLQNLIAQRVYNPTQDLGQDVPGSSALGFGVGAESSVLLDMLRGVFRRRPRGPTTQPAPTPTPEAAPTPTPAAPPPTIDLERAEAAARAVRQAREREAESRAAAMGDAWIVIDQYGMLTGGGK